MGEWGGRKIIYLSLHCHHQNDSCIKIGSDESHFNVSVESHKTVSTNHNLFEEKGEPKWFRTEVFPPSALPLGQIGSPNPSPVHPLHIAIADPTGKRSAGG